MAATKETKGSATTMMTLPRFLRVVGPSLFVAIWLASAVMGQTETATVSGLVTDRTAAAVSGAEVRLQSVERGTVTTTTTNNAGIYVFPSVQPGQYQISIQTQGFKQVDLLGLVVNVQDHIEQNFRLEVGSVAESVTVEAAASMINTTDATVSTVVDRQFAENLPLNGRSFQTLIQLTPGVVLTAANQVEQGQFSVNGQRADANYFTVDGVSANFGANANILNQSAGGTQPAFAVTGGTNSLVSVDALQEFRIQTSTFAPEFGRTPGGQVSIVTRSGTNQFHGTLFDYLRNDVLDANDWFADRASLKKAADRQNDFGGVLGGPIKKDRTFFFFSYEGLRLRLPRTQIETVPTIGFRQAAVPGIQPILNAYPIPNGTDFGNGLAAFDSTFSDPSTLDATSIRVDHRRGNKVMLFGRYNYSPADSIQRAASATSTSSLFHATSKVHTLTIGSTQLLTTAIGNDLRVNWSKNTGGAFFFQDSIGGAVPPSDSAFFPSFASRMDSGFTFQAPSGMSRIAVGAENAHNEQSQLNIVDNLSMTEGSHQLKFGVDYRRLTPVSAGNAYTQIVRISNLTQLQSGMAARVRLLAADEVELVFHNYSAYAQDTWRASSRFALTYGLRWDVNPAPGTLNGKPLFAVQGLGNAATIALAPQGTPVYQTTYDNVAPRVGLAYQLSQGRGRETVFRGGFGIFYDLASGSLGNAANNFPYSRERDLSNTQVPVPTAQAAAPPFTVTPAAAFFVTTTPDLKLPRVFQWNGAVEQSVGTSQVLTLSYVGALGRRLLRQDNFFLPNPAFNLVSVTRNSATSDYHAMQLQFSRRMSKGLQALVSYAWSHSIDTASNDSNSGYAPPNVVDPRTNRGSSDFDVRHSFSGAVTYNIPSPRGRIRQAVLGKWSVDTIFFARSATPVDLIGSFSSSGFLSSLRPDVVSGQSFYLYGPQYPGGKAFNAAAFKPTTGLQGTLGRNELRGFPANQFNLALRRQFDLTERLKLQFRTEFFNIFNHPNFANPGNFQGNFVGSPLFGQSTSMLNSSLGSGGANGGLSPLYQIGGPRSIQFALKFNF